MSTTFKKHEFKVKRNMKYGITNFLLACLLFIPASAVEASFGSVWSTSATETTITINWTSLPYGKYKWSGSYPKYKICYKKAGQWVGSCSAHTVTTNSKPYTITGLESGTSYKIKVYSHTLKKNIWGNWKNPKFRKVGTLTQSTQTSVAHTGTLSIVGATDSSLDVKVTYSHPSDFENIRVCYKKTGLPISLNAKCSQSDIVTPWTASNKNRGWLEVTSVSNVEMTLHPWTPLSKCRNYKVVAYGFPVGSSFGIEIGNHVIGRTNGSCWWWLKKGIVTEISNDHPEVLSAYVEKVNASYEDKGTSLFSHLANQYPVLSQVERKLITEDSNDSSFNNPFELLDYLSDSQTDVLRAWQEEEGLKEAQLDLETFTKTEFPEVAELLPQKEFEIANAYVTAVDTFYKGEDSWFTHLTKQHPDLLEAKQVVAEDSNYDLNEPRVVFDYLQGERQDIWDMWQTEESFLLSLEEAGLDLETFVKENYPDYWDTISSGTDVCSNATYSNETRQAILPCVDIPLYTDVAGSPIKLTGLYSVMMEIPFGFSDFEVKEVTFLELIETPNPLHAHFNPDTGILDVPRIDIPVIVPLFGGKSTNGPTLQCSATLQRSALRAEVLMLKEFDCKLP